MGSTKFSNYAMKAPASSSYWDFKFLDDNILNTVTLANGSTTTPILDITLDLGSLNYEEINIFSDKIFFIKNLANKNKISATFLDDEALTVSKWHYEWIFKQGKSSKEKSRKELKFSRSSSPDILNDFAKTVLVRKYASDWKTIVFEMKAKVIPDNSIYFSFDWNDSIMTKVFSYEVLKIENIEFFGNIDLKSFSNI